MGRSSKLSRTAWARALPPSPPLAKTSLSTHLTCMPAQKSATMACSSSVSVGKALTATTTGRPKPSFMFSMWRPRLASPARTASGLGLFRSALATPPWLLRARTVATSTQAEGAMPAARHLMSRNFSAPRSAPKPASVTT